MVVVHRILGESGDKQKEDPIGHVDYKTVDLGRLEIRIIGWNVKVRALGDWSLGGFKMHDFACLFFKGTMVVKNQ